MTDSSTNPKHEITQICIVVRDIERSMKEYTERLGCGRGQLVSVRVRTGEDRAALVIASEAIQRGVDGSFVYRVGGDDKVEAVPVRIGYQDSGVSVIAPLPAAVGAHLDAGDRVVRDGQSRLKPGAKVSEAEPVAAVAR